MAILLINKCDQLPPQRTNQKIPSSASKQDEDRDDVIYEDIPDSIDMKVIHKRNTNYKDECIKEQIYEEECMERGDSIQSKYSTSHSTFSCQRFMR